MPFITGGFVGVGQTIALEPESGQLIATGQLTATGNHTVIQVRNNCTYPVYQRVVNCLGLRQVIITGLTNL